MTEAFAATLEHGDHLARLLISEWFEIEPPTDRLRIGTQRPTASGGYVDCELAFGSGSIPDLLVWIEVKRSAPVEESQLNTYADDIEHVPAVARRLGVLAPRGSMPASVLAAEPFTWQQVAAACRRYGGEETDPIGQFFVEEFSSFLEEEALADAPALTAAHAFTFAARPAADRTIATLLELTAGHVSRAWGEPEDFGRISGSKNANYGPGWWAGYATAPAGQDPASTWGGTWFEWGLRPDSSRRDSRDAFAFDAGAAFDPKGTPVKVAGNEPWLAARAGAGFEYLQSYWWRLVRYKYPEELLAQQTLEDQAEVLGAWVAAAFAGPSSETASRVGDGSMGSSRRTSAWAEGVVDRTSDHLILSHRDSGGDPVAFVGPAVDGVFPVEYVLNATSRRESVRADIVRELDYYLVEKGEPDPFAYAWYHAGTMANLYSSVHWGAWSTAVAAAEDQE